MVRQGQKRKFAMIATTSSSSYPPPKKLNAAVIFQGGSLSGSFKKTKIATKTLLPDDGVIAVQCNNLSKSWSPDSLPEQ